MFLRILAVVAVILTLAFGGAASAAPAMWVVKDADSEIYLFGTMHILRRDGTECASGGTDAMGGTIQTDGTGRLVTSNGGFYIDQPVAWADMDSFRHVNNVVYFRYFENVRLEYFRRIGWWEYMDETGIGRLASLELRFGRIEFPRRRKWIGR